jgi:predicted nucleic acid-binding Zn ribbon protein
MMTADFAQFLNQGMDDRDLGPTTLGKAVGHSKDVVRRWMDGDLVPEESTQAVISRLFEETPKVEKPLGSRDCVFCGTTFEPSQRLKITCSIGCRELHAEAQRRQAEPVKLTGALGAIHDYCLACEPEGICRVPTCPLRLFSPLECIPYSDEESL